MPIPAGWGDFVKEYRADGHFQYFPHAHVGTDRFVAIVGELAKFEGTTWNETNVMAALRKAKLTSGKSSGGRMIRKATENLGFCWFDKHVLWMTPAGRAFVSDRDRPKLMERLLWRYQLDNPVNDGAKGFDIFPHAALIEMLLALDGKLTRDEFILFAGRCRKRADLSATVKRVRAWRKLTIAQEDAVIAALPKGEIEQRTTDISYVLGFHGCASYLTRFSDRRRRKGILIAPGRRPELEERLAEHLGAAATRLEFRKPSDCISYYGDIEKAVDPLANVEYLLETSQWKKAVKAFRKLPPGLRGGRTVADFEREVFLEKDLEDYLESRLQLIEKGLKLRKRQYGLEAGTIDLLATAANGDLVVIELKKVRASDKVFGQLCRYMGCMAAHHAKGRKVRGYIVGSEIDDKLRYAAAVVPTGVVRLKRFRRDPASPKIFIED